MTRHPENTAMTRLPVLKPATCRCLLFTRFPEAGRVKTRLIPRLGPAGAARLQQRLTEHAAAQVAALAPAIGREVWYAGGDGQQMRAWLGPGFSYHQQAEGGLGTRLFTALASARLRGAERMVLVGADCPALASRDIEQAFRLLEGHGLVLGPARDGGYYLIGLVAPAVRKELFANIPWGSHRVLAATLAAAAALDIRARLLEEKTDIDRPADLGHLAGLAAARRTPAAPPSREHPPQQHRQCTPRPTWR